MKSTIVRRNAWEINTSFYFLSSCSDAHQFVPSKTLLMWSRWFDTVSTNLGTSLGFDHNDQKNVRFLTLATFILWKMFLLEGDVA